MEYVPAFFVFAAAGVALWMGSCLLGWVLNRRASRRDGSEPEPFNWRVLVNPGLYYEWVARGDSR